MIATVSRAFQNISMLQFDFSFIKILIRQGEKIAMDEVKR